MSYAHRELAGRVMNLWDDAVAYKCWADAAEIHMGKESTLYSMRLLQYTEAWEAYQKANTELFLLDVQERKA